MLPVPACEHLNVERSYVQTLTGDLSHGKRQYLGCQAPRGTLVSYVSREVVEIGVGPSLGGVTV